ncbi:MAG: amino acid adenylation domain protein, partial [Firmicutes bacterium]|nr:amino acid adenylation domain protein [Bacillota bacterium]
TGKPKGVQLEHRSVVNFLTAMRREPGLTAADVLVAVTPISFDIAVLELFLPLTVGARVVIASRDVATDGTRLLDLLKGCGATVMQATPATWRLLLAAGWTAGADMKLLCGGEALPRELALRLMSGGGALWNMYGPTETTVWSSLQQVTAESGPVAIGRPIGNTRLYILDPHGKVVPVGVAGELHIGGAGLARGYLHRSELTAEKFIPSPFVVGDRLYRTGDLARYLPSGAIQYLGRIDDQVKIRGFRIELGEIEAVLAQHPDVQQAVVVAREYQPGDMRLVGYLVPKSEEAGEAMEAAARDLIPQLRSHLKAALPEYMVPPVFVLLERLPLTPNGKVDRRALPAPDQERMALEQAYAPPSTEIEGVLSGIWEQILGVNQIGVHDNFFSLGGHSLLATQAISRMRDAFAVDLPLRSLFENPTVASMAVVVEAARNGGDHIAMAPILPIARDGDLPLSFSQERLWFVDQLEPGSSLYNIPAAIRLTGPLDVAALEQSLNEIIRRHETLRSTFSNVAGRSVQHITAFQPVPLQCVNLTALPDDERAEAVRRLVSEESRRPFDLARGPLLRTTLLVCSATEHVLLPIMHHIIADGWSTGVLVREAATLYQAFAAGQPSPLPELPIQYADFAAWQRSWFVRDVQEQQLAYWRQQLTGVEVLQLPTDHPRPAVPTRTGALASLKLTQALTEGLKAVGRQEGVTLFMTLLAAFQALLHRYTHQADIAVGSPVANRNRAETEGLIGFFVNTLVLRTDLSGNPTFRELLERVRENTLGAYSHQDMPFEQLVEALQPERDLSHSPLFQVMFVLQNVPVPALELSELTLTPLAVESGAAKFDLSLAMT